MDDEQRKQVGDEVKDERKRRGWSQGELARRARVSPNTVLAIEKAKYGNANLGKLRQVLDVLNLAPLGDEMVLDLTGLPQDVATFLRVAAPRLGVIEEQRRAVLLADLYPRILNGST